MKEVQLREASENPDMKPREAILHLHKQTWDYIQTTMLSGIGEQPPYQTHLHKHLAKERLYTYEQVRNSTKGLRTVRWAHKQLGNHTLMADKPDEPDHPTCDICKSAVRRF